MRIAYLVSQYPALSHTFIRREVAALRRKGLDIQTFSVRKPLPEEIRSRIDQEEFEKTWYILPISPIALLRIHLVSLVQHPLYYFQTLALSLKHRVPGTRALIYALFYFAEAIPLAHELKRRDIQHIHNHFAQAGATVGLLASHYLHIKWSLTLHGTCDFEYPAALLLNDKCAVATFVACISHFGRAQAMRLLEPIYWQKLFVYRCGVELKDVSLCSKETVKEASERLRILCVARLSPEKGLIGLIEAFAQVVRQNVSNVELRIVGEGPERDKIEKQILKYDIQSQCVLLGGASEEEVFRELASADILVLSSFMEGLPVVIMEAFACSIPVIAPRVAGIPEIVKDEHSGLLFSPANWEELAEQLILLTQGKSMRLRFGAEGRQRVEAEFDIYKAVEPLLKRFQGEI